MRNLFLLSFLFFFIRCGERKEISASFGPSVDEDLRIVKYAKGFTIQDSAGYRIIKVFPAWSRKKEALFTYILVPEGQNKPEPAAGAFIIEVPVRSVVCLSSLYVSYLDRLKLLPSLKAVDNFRYINSAGVNALIGEGKIAEVGSEGAVNLEKVIDLKPDLVFTYVQGNAAYDTHPAFIGAGIPVAGAIDQLENTPLGRAEWIRFIAAFYQKDREADSIFRGIASNYERLAESGRRASPKPTVFTDIKYDAWYMPGGNSYMATLLKDAGARYIWEKDSNTGSIPLSFEQVLDKAKDADYWINSGSWNSLEDALRHDSRNSEFKAFRNRMIYNNNKRVNKYGGNDYWESGLLNPDLLLKDLLSIFHPGLLPAHELTYYKRLEK
jgi:iron complex transport system substrate-binding protein